MGVLALGGWRRRDLVAAVRSLAAGPLKTLRELGVAAELIPLPLELTLLWGHPGRAVGGRARVHGRAHAGLWVVVTHVVAEETIACGLKNNIYNLVRTVSTGPG